MWALLCGSPFLPVICRVTLGETVPSWGCCSICWDDRVGANIQSLTTTHSVPGPGAWVLGPELWSFTALTQSLAPLFLFDHRPVTFLGLFLLL